MERNRGRPRAAAAKRIGSRTPRMPPARLGKSRTSSSGGRARWGRALRALPIALLLASASPGFSRAADPAGEHAVVIQGAHLLQRREGGGGYARVAYLPVGTVVELTGEQRRIGVRGRPRPFSSVVSQSGARGFLSDRLYQPIGDARLALPVSSAKLPLFAQSYGESAVADIVEADAAEPPCDERCIAFSRSDGIFLQVVDDGDDYYEVILNRTLTQVDDGPDLVPREQKRWYLEKFLVNTGQVKLIDRDLAARSMTQWEADDQASIAGDPELFSKLLERVKQLTDAPVVKAMFWCNLAIDATGKVSANLWLAEFGISGAVSPKKAGEFRMKTHYDWKTDQGTAPFDVYRDVACKNSEPETTMQLTMRPQGPGDAIQVDLDRLKERSCHAEGGAGCSDWIFLKASGDDYEKMVIVNDWPSYNAVLREIERAARRPISPRHVDYSDDPDEVRAVQEGIVERQNLYDFILREIAIFRDP